jgi:hypothetical protein
LGCRRGDTQLDQGCVTQEGLLALLALGLQRAPSGRLSFRICGGMQRIVVAGDARCSPRRKCRRTHGLLRPLAMALNVPPNFVARSQATFKRRPGGTVSTERSAASHFLPTSSGLDRVAILLPQALDCTLRVGKCRRFVRQKCAVGSSCFLPSGHRIAKKYRGTATSSRPAHTPVRPPTRRV